MTEQEKKDNPNYETTEGYLKVLEYKEAFQESYNRASKEDREKIFNIPNFNAKKFFEISGIDVKINTEASDEKEALLSEILELNNKAAELAERLAKL
jgi:hypothetical protein